MATNREERFSQRQRGAGARNLDLAFDLVLPGVPTVSRTPLKSRKSMGSGHTPLPDLPPAKSVRKPSSPSHRSLSSTRITPDVFDKKASGLPRKRSRPPKKPIPEVICEEDIVGLKLSQISKDGEATTTWEPAAKEPIDVQKPAIEPEIKKRKRRRSIGQQPKKRTRINPLVEREESQVNGIFLPSPLQEVNNRMDIAPLIEMINKNPRKKGTGSIRHPCVPTVHKTKGQKGRGRPRKESKISGGQSVQSNRDRVLSPSPTIESHVKKHENLELENTEEQKHSEAPLTGRKRGKPQKRKDESETQVDKRQRKPQAIAVNSTRMSESKLAIPPNSAASEELETTQDVPAVQRPKLVKKTRGCPKAAGKSPKVTVNQQESAQDRETGSTAWKESSFEQPAVSKPKPKKRRVIGQQRPRRRPPKSSTMIQNTEEISLVDDKIQLQPSYDKASEVEGDQAVKGQGIIKDNKPDEQDVLKPAAAPPKKRGRPPKTRVPMENKTPVRSRQKRTVNLNLPDRAEADFPIDPIQAKPPASNTQPTQPISPPAPAPSQPKKRGRPKKQLLPSSDTLTASQSQKSKPTRKPRTPMTKNVRQPPPDLVPILTRERAYSDQALVANTTNAPGPDPPTALPDNEVLNSSSVPKQVAQEPNFTFDGGNDLELREASSKKQRIDKRVEDYGKRRRAMSEAPAGNKGGVAMTTSHCLLDAPSEPPVLPAQEVSDETRGLNHIFKDLNANVEAEARRAKEGEIEPFAQPRRAVSEVPASGLKELSQLARKAGRGKEVVARWDRLARASGVARKEREPSVLGKIGGGRLGGFLRKLGGEEISDELQGILDQVKGVPVEGEGI
ncbi:MAG: hypothetical protein LQ342_005990 [Letrouitia transgressa]|nr:MAG: hypothetical protein LQ342_005990 [Letrouitia transgressa]